MPNLFKRITTAVKKRVMVARSWFSFRKRKPPKAEPLVKKMVNTIRNPKRSVVKIAYRVAKTIASNVVANVKTATSRKTLTPKQRLKIKQQLELDDKIHTEKAKIELKKVTNPELFEKFEVYEEKKFVNRERYFQYLKNTVKRLESSAVNRNTAELEIYNEFKEWLMASGKEEKLTPQQQQKLYQHFRSARMSNQDLKLNRKLIKQINKEIKKEKIATAVAETAEVLI